MERRKIIYTIKNHHNNPQKVQEVIEKVNQSGGIEYARNKMIEFRNNALVILDSFPSSEYRESLESLVIYTTERNK